MVRYCFVVGNDNGNSEHAVMVDGSMITQPNVNCKADKLPWSDYSKCAEGFMDNLYEQMVVTVNSPACRPSIYKVGEFALRSGEIVENMQVGVDLKSESELPVVNTLAVIAACAVKKAYEEEKALPDKIEIRVDMATALPVRQHTKENSLVFRNKFMGNKHFVTVHLGASRVDTEIVFDFVKVVPEGTPVIFALQSMDKEFFTDFNGKYNLKADGKYFSGKRVLHVDIGDGTTEYPITEGQGILSQHIEGSYNGVGHALEESINEFNRLINLPESPRQFFSDVLKNKNHKYYGKAVSTIKTPLERQAMKIMSHITGQLNRIRNEVDVIAVYGGGSILMRQFLFSRLDALCNEREIKLLYVPESYATLLNAIGLDIFARGGIFKALKKSVMNGDANG